MNLPPPISTFHFPEFSFSNTSSSEYTGGVVSKLRKSLFLSLSLVLSFLLFPCRSASPQNLARDPSMVVVPALVRPLCLPRDHYRHHSRLSHRRSKGHRRRPSRQRDQDRCRPCSSNQPPRRREARTDCRRRWQERVHPQQECKGARKAGRCRRCHPCSPQDKCHPNSSQRSSSRRRTRRRRCRRNNRHSPCKRTQPLSSRSSRSSLQRHARRGRFARACRSKSSSTSERGSTLSTAC